MAQVPNICYDIFSNIANLLGNFEALADGPQGSGDFTHGAGFNSPVQSPLEQSTQATTPFAQFGATSPDQLLQWLFMFVMVMFLMFGQRPREPTDLKQNHRSHPSGGNDHHEIH